MENNPAHEIAKVPVIRECGDGSWLAVGPPHDHYRVGVMGATKTEARRKYDAARQRQIEAHDRPSSEETRDRNG